MYWYKSRRFLNLAFTFALLPGFIISACKPDIKETGAGLKYFDVKGYFAKDTAALQRLNKPVVKTVSHNGVSESKTVHIADWGQELNFFVASDINKPAWRNSYTIVDNDDFLIYRAKDPELQMHQMVIKKAKEKGKILWILIFNHTKNILYQTTEKLTYYPDSLYEIEKDQHVRLMGNNHYKITGLIQK